MILLNKWQRTQRLAGSAETGWVVENLLLDSLLFLHVLPPSLTSLLELGYGAGIPRIPIKIVVLVAMLVLVASRRHRASFLSTVVKEARLVATDVGHTKRAGEPAIAVEPSLGRKPRVRFAPVASWISRSELRAAGFEPGGRACRRLGSGRRWRLLVQLGGEILVDLQPVDLPE